MCECQAWIFPNSRTGCLKPWYRDVWTRTCRKLPVWSWSPSRGFSRGPTFCVSYSSVYDSSPRGRSSRGWKIVRSYVWCVRDWREWLPADGDWSCSCRRNSMQQRKSGMRGTWPQSPSWAWGEAPMQDLNGVDCETCKESQSVSSTLFAQQNMLSERLIRALEISLRTLTDTITSINFILDTSSETPWFDKSRIVICSTRWPLPWLDVFVNMYATMGMKILYDIQGDLLSVGLSRALFCFCQSRAWPQLKLSNSTIIAAILKSTSSWVLRSGKSLCSKQRRRLRVYLNPPSILYCAEHPACGGPRFFHACIFALDSPSEANLVGVLLAGIQPRSYVCFAV